MNRFFCNLSVYAFVLTFVLNVRAQAVLPDSPNPRFTDGVEFVVKAFDQYPVVAIADLPGCDEFHRFLRTLIESPAFGQKVHNIIVDFGNPLLQPVLDRYLTDGELMPSTVLRHVWDDTTESPDLTWDSPLYAAFFDAIRAVNLGLPKEQRLRVTLADAPVSWRKIQTKQQWLNLRGQPREDALATAVEDILGQHERALVISAAVHLYQNSDLTSNARALIEKVVPGRLFLVLPQGRFGAGDSYKEVERREQGITPGSITLLRNTWLGAQSITGAPGSPQIEDVADAVLYLGSGERLTKIQPTAVVFRDEEFWAELNRRWKLIYDMPFDLATAGFDLRGPYIWPPPQMVAASARPASSVVTANAVDFVFEKLDQYSIVGIGDLHMCLQYFQFLQQLVKDPRLPGKIQDIVVEFGNPLYQDVVDSYVLEGKDVSLAVRGPVWQEAAMGWYVANSPIYEAFYDELRAVNLKLPKEARIRVILGDAPLNVGRFRANSDKYFEPFLAYKETLEDPREISIAATITRVVAAGRRALVLCGNGHLNLTQRSGNARHIFERSYPNRFYLIDESGPGNPSWPIPSIVTWADDREPNHAMLWLGPLDSLTVVRPSPLIYRDTSYWTFINLMAEVQGRYPVDLASASFEYRTRYPWTQ
jgi:hypothetical protein